MDGRGAAPDLSPGVRVLQVAEASASGTFEVLRSIAAGADARGHDVCVALGRRPQTPTDLAERLGGGIELRLLPWATRGPADQVRAARALRALAVAWEPDVVHLHSAFAGIVGSAAIPRGIPIVYTPHASPTARGSDGAARRAVYRLAETAVARRAAVVVGAVSEAEAALVRTQLRARDVRVVPNGIAELDPGSIPSPARREGRPLVVATGRIDEQRRPAESAAILSALTDLAEVRWIGGAPAGEDRPLLDAGVPVTGWLPREEAVDQLAGATAYLHWSAWDGLSLALLEAMARDVVTIASDIPANAEVVGPRQVAHDVAGAVALLRRVLTEPAFRAERVAEQHERRARYGVAAAVEGWLALYADCLTAQR